MTDFPIDALQAVSRDDTQPAYAQIAEQLRRVIVNRKVTPGTQLPSETELVQRFLVSRMTVREGIRVLRQNNTLRAHQGVGVFVGDRSHDENHSHNPDRRPTPGEPGGATVTPRPSEVARFLTDLQEHIETVTTFYIPQDELSTVLTRMAEDGHREIPTT